MLNLRIIPLALMLLSVIVLPYPAAAASSKTTCAITVTAPNGEVRATTGTDVLVKKGDKVGIEWESKNAKKAVDSEGDTIKLSDSDSETISETTEFSYTFSNGSKKTTCGFTAVVADGEIDSKSLTATTPKPTLTGTVEGVKTIQVIIHEDDEDGKTVFKSKEIKVKRGKWSAKVTKSLGQGDYYVELLGPKSAELNVLDTATLEITTKGKEKETSSSSKTSSSASSSKASGSFTVSSVPLLFGGTAKAGTSVPVAYLKLVNTSSEEASIKGFSLKQNGTAPVSIITGFTTSDDKGGSIGEVSAKFSNGVAYVPLAATFAPGQMRIFSIKAILSPSATLSIGQNLMLDAVGVDTGAKLPSVFPVRGTTWTLSY